MSTLKVDTILKRTGTGTITLGQSGDTISVPTGASLSLQGGSNGQALTTNGSGTLSFATVGGENAPVFKAYQSSAQTISNTTYTIVNLQSTSFDPSSKFNTSNYRFTPTVAGYYFLQAQVRVDTSNDMQTLQATIRKNASAIVRSTDVSQNYGSAIASALIYSDTDDYFDMEVYHDAGGNTNLVNDAQSTFFQGYRLI